MTEIEMREFRISLLLENLSVQDLKPEAERMYAEYLRRERAKKQEAMSDEKIINYPERLSGALT